MAILQVGLKSSVWPRRKQWYRSFCRTRLQLARRGQNVAKNSATLCVEGPAAVGPRILEHVTFLLRPRVLEHVTFIAPRVLQHVTFPRVLQSVVLFLATFWPLLACWSRVRQNDLYHRFRLGQAQLLRPTCKISNGSL